MDTESPEQTLVSIVWRSEEHQERSVQETSEVAQQTQCCG